MICPCKVCEKKGCGKLHDTCVPYQEWNATNEERNRQRRLERRELSTDQERKYRKNLKRGRAK